MTKPLDPEFGACSIRKAAIIARHGSVEAATAPCWREKLILAAVAPWRTVQCPPNERWTDKLDGWCGFPFDYREAPTHVMAAISAAYPMPATFTEAKAESDYWDARSSELESISRIDDFALDLAAGLRAEMVRDLAERDVPGNEAHSPSQEASAS